MSTAKRVCVSFASSGSVKYDRRVPLSSHGDGSDGVMPLGPWIALASMSPANATADERIASGI
jgi:hypothetical protein